MFCVAVPDAILFIFLRAAVLLAESSMSNVFHWLENISTHAHIKWECLLATFNMCIVHFPCSFLIHEAHPTVTAGSDHLIWHMLSVRTSTLSKTKQISSEANVRCWRDCGSGRVDHWWHLSCLPLRINDNCIVAMIILHLPCHCSDILQFNNTNGFSLTKNHGTYLFKFLQNYTTC